MQVDIGIIDYDNEGRTNEYRSKDVASLMACVFGVNAKDQQVIYNSVMTELAWYDKRSQSEIENKKKQNKLFLKEIAKYQLSDTAPQHFKDLFKQLSQSAFKNIAHSLLRIPEWFMVSEKGLKRISSNMYKNREEILALGLRRNEYPYEGSLSDCRNLNAIYNDLRLQENNVISFAKDPDRGDIDDPIAFRKVNADNIISAMERIKRWVSGLEETPNYALSWVQMVRSIRRDVNKINIKLEHVLKDGFKPSDFNMSQSRGAEDFEPLCKSVMARAGWTKDNGELKKIPIVVGNYFHFFYTEDLPIPITSGQVDASNHGSKLYAEVGPGLGPCFKIRYVYTTFAEIQSYASIPADFLKKKHELCYMYAYLGQTDYILRNKNEYKDVQCTDITGYSDYLNRNLYDWLLKLYGFSEKVRKSLMTIFSMDISIRDSTGQHILPVPYGALQGVKLLVFIMNDANAAIGLIQNQLRIIKWTDRQNAGDDVYSASRDEEMTLTDLNIDMLTWMYFNCPTNMSKTAWLKRDGYWDFCKVYFSNGGEPITGLPPKLYMKQVLFIRDISEIYKVADRSGVVLPMKISDLTDKDNPLSLYELLERNWRLGSKLKNRILEDNSMETKYKIARQIPYTIGGLSEEPMDTVSRLNHLIVFCDKLYHEYEFEVGDIYAFAIKVGISGEFGKFIAGIKVSEGNELMQIIIRINDCYNNYLNYGYVDQEEVDKLESLLEMRTRITLATGIPSKSGSTYHRITPNEDKDITLVVHENWLDGQHSFVYELPKSFHASLIYEAILNDVDIADIDRINYASKARLYYQEAYEEGRVVSGGGGNHRNASNYLYLISKDQTERYRLYKTSSDEFRESADPDLPSIFPRGCAKGKDKYILDVFLKYRIQDTIYGVDAVVNSLKKEVAGQIADLINDTIQNYIRNNPDLDLNDQHRREMDSYMNEKLEEMLD